MSPSDVPTAGALRRTSQAPPVRAVHLGLGSFHRAHQAWYTQACAPHPQAVWGIAAFTGRTSHASDLLAAQACLYHVMVRRPDGDSTHLVHSIGSAVPGDDRESWLSTVSDERVGLITLTVTEAGYRRAADGGLDVTDPSVVADIAALRSVRHGPHPCTAPGRLVAGLRARRVVSGAPIAVVPCDNLAGNGAATKRVVTDLAAAVEPGLASWIDENVSFVDTVVDRITPKTTPADIAGAEAAHGWRDEALVVTEPFTEWVLAGAFPAGRPPWQDAGATFTDDVAPFADRKLWLLNGAHSLLAYAAPARGHRTVAEAVSDAVCREWLDHWWEAASQTLLAGSGAFTPDDCEQYRLRLLDRFSNPRIAHQLSQIAVDGSVKLTQRLVPVLRAGLKRGGCEAADAPVQLLGAWMAALRSPRPPADVQAARLQAAVRSSSVDTAANLLGLLAPELPDHAGLAHAVADACARFEALRTRKKDT